MLSKADKKLTDRRTGWEVDFEIKSCPVPDEAVLRSLDAETVFYAARRVPGDPSDTPWRAGTLSFHSGKCDPTRIATSAYEAFAGRAVLDISACSSGAHLALFDGVKDDTENEDDKKMHLVQLRLGSSAPGDGDDGGDGEAKADATYPLQILIVALELLLGALLAFGVWRAARRGEPLLPVSTAASVTASSAPATLEMEDADGFAVGGGAARAPPGPAPGVWVYDMSEDISCPPKPASLP